MTSAEIMRDSIMLFFHSGSVFSFALATVLVGVALLFLAPDYLTKGQKSTLKTLSIVLTPYVIYIIYVIIRNGGVLTIY